MLDFLPIGLLKQAKVPNIKRLKQIRQIRRHIERNNLICLVIFLKVEGVVTFVAIKDQKIIITN
jgi:hypothetical protein